MENETRESRILWKLHSFSFTSRKLHIQVIKRVSGATWKIHKQPHDMKDPLLTLEKRSIVSVANSQGGNDTSQICRVVVLCGCGICDILRFQIWNSCQVGAKLFRKFANKQRGSLSTVHNRFDSNERFFQSQRSPSDHGVEALPCWSNSHTPSEHDMPMILPSWKWNGFGSMTNKSNPHQFEL